MKHETWEAWNISLASREQSGLQCTVVPVRRVHVPVKKKKGVPKGKKGKKAKEATARNRRETEETWVFSRFHVHRVGSQSFESTKYTQVLGLQIWKQSILDTQVCLWAMFGKNLSISWQCHISPKPCPQSLLDHHRPHRPQHSTDAKNSEHNASNALDACKKKWEHNAIRPHVHYIGQKALMKNGAHLAVPTDVPLKSRTTLGAGSFSRTTTPHSRSSPWRPGKNPTCPLLSVWNRRECRRSY